MKLHCDSCHTDFEELGALILSPPMPAPSALGNMVRKFHICRGCYETKIVPVVDDQRPTQPPPATTSQPRR